MSLIFTLNDPAHVSLIFSATGAPVTGVVAADVTAYYSKAGATPQILTLTPSTFIELSAANMPGVYGLDIAATYLDTPGEFVVSFQGAAFDTYLIRGYVYNGAFNEIDATASSTLSQAQANGTLLGTIDTTTSGTSGTVGSISATLAGTDTKVTDIQGAGFATGTDSLAALQANLATKMPSEVALKAHLVDGTGGIIPPTNKGIWDALGDGTASISSNSLDLKRVLGLSQENYSVSAQTYDANDNLISGIVNIYGSAVDLAASLNPIATYVISASYDTSNRLITYQVAKQ